MALCRNLNKRAIDGGCQLAIFQYARQDERERMDQDSALAGVSCLSQRDQRSRQDAAFVGAAQAWEPQTGVLRLWSEDRKHCRGLRAGGTGSTVVGISHHRGDRTLSHTLSGVQDQGGESAAAAEQGPPSVSAVRKRWDKPVRAHRYDEWRGSLACRPARCERSTCGICGGGQRGDVDRRCG